MSYLKFIYYALLLSGFLIILIRWRKLDSILHIFGPVYFFTLITEIYCDFFKVYFPYHINQTIGYFFLCLYYYHLFYKKRNRKIVLAGFGIYLMYFYYYFIYHSENFNIFNPADFVVEGIFVSIFSVLILIEFYERTDIIIFKNNPHFWLVVANLFFFSGCLILMGCLHYLDRYQKDLYHQVVYISYVLNLLFYSLYIKAFTCK